MRLKPAGELLHSNELPVPKDLNHIFISDIGPKLPSAMQFLAIYRARMKDAL